MWIEEIRRNPVDSNEPGNCTPPRPPQHSPPPSDHSPSLPCMLSVTLSHICACLFSSLPPRNHGSPVPGCRSAGTMQVSNRSLPRWCLGDLPSAEDRQTDAPVEVVRSCKSNAHLPGATCSVSSALPGPASFSAVTQEQGPEHM